MVIVVFRSRVRESADLEALARLGGRMYELAAAMPGFVSYKDFTAEDGESVSIVAFESPETLEAWRDHPEHRQAQQAGRDSFFQSYEIQVCSLIRTSAFSMPD